MVVVVMMTMTMTMIMLEKHYAYTRVHMHHRKPLLLVLERFLARLIPVSDDRPHSALSRRHRHRPHLPAMPHRAAEAEKDAVDVGRASWLEGQSFLSAFPGLRTTPTFPPTRRCLKRRRFLGGSGEAEECTGWRSSQGSSCLLYTSDAADDM
eukprot:3026199-Rhodomonas_salina.1